MKPYTQKRNERGAILIIALIMLVVLTIIAVSTLRGTTMDERMAGNSRDRDKALQSAEAAVRNCMGRLLATPRTYPPTKIIAPTAPPTAPNWETASVWAASGDDVAMTDAGLASNPQCLIEDLGGGTGYRVTGRAVGGSSNAVVILQATYSTD